MRLRARTTEDQSGRGAPSLAPDAEHLIAGKRRVQNIWAPDRRSGRTLERLRTGAAEGRSGREPERPRSEVPEAAKPSTGHMSDLAGQRRGWLSRVGRAGGPSRWGPMREGPRRGGLIQGNRSKDVRAEGVRAEMVDREGAEPRMSIQGVATMDEGQGRVGRALARSRALERQSALSQLECRSTRAAERRVPGITER